MLILTVICFLAGAILGFRFKVFILVPAIGLALAVVVLNGVAVEEGAWRLVGKMVVVAASVQLGLRCYLTVRHPFDGLGRPPWNFNAVLN
jgi:hypothetical protein